MHKLISLLPLLLAIAILNVWLILRRVTFRGQGNLPHEFSYIGKDYPLTYPLPTPLETVALTLHNSVHFALNKSDPEAQNEWRLFAMLPKGVGRTRLGPDRRVFILTIAHQMHCLWVIQLALVDHSNSFASPEHFSHCLNYLRQTMLCEAADSLENGDTIQDIDGDGGSLGTSLVCQDWEKAYSFFDEKNAEWEEWRMESGI